MSSVSHQTVKLSSGKHSSPDDGACVMELASMLAGEKFTDHPVSVCPVIGSFLRAYNDSIDDRRRQDLYPYAAMVVGSRGNAEAQRMRAKRLAQWSLDMRRGPIGRLLAIRALSRLEKVSHDWIGPIAVRSIDPRTEESHAAVLALIDELLGIGRSETSAGVVARERSHSLSSV